MINYPIFVPDMGVNVTQLLVAGKLTLFFGELQRLSALGSRPASALLAYLCLKGAVDGVPSPDRAQALCSDAARSGDAYSQYVMGWICRVKGLEGEAMDWLRKAAAKGIFLPAIVDVGRFMIGGVGVKAPDVRAARAVLWDAHKLGHRMALVYIAEMFRRGYMGPLGRLVGAALYPVAIARASMFSRRWPLSDRVFVNLASAKHPLFKIPVPSSQAHAPSEGD